MSGAEREMWRINIENAATAVCRIYGTEVAQSVFNKYDATAFDNLSSCYYAEVFGDLEMMATDN